MSRKQEKHGKEKETIKGWKMNTRKHTQKSSNGKGHLERNGVCERFKMILEGEERMRENMNRKDENARESLNHFEIAFLLVCYEELKIWDLILTISSSYFFFFHCEPLWEWWSYARHTLMDVPRFMRNFQHTNFNSAPFSFS